MKIVQFKKMIKNVTLAAIAALLLLPSATTFALAAEPSATTVDRPGPPNPQITGSIFSSSTTTNVPDAINKIATVKKVSYYSNNHNDTATIVTGLIMTPKVKVANAKVVAWGHGTTGYGDQCAPSTNKNVFWSEAVDAVTSYLKKGWTVAATDYIGLGGSGSQPYLVGNDEARSMIDSVRAARNLDSTLSRDWVAAGHSQGGQGALFAGEISSNYGNELRLKGVVAVAPVSNADIIAANVAGTPGQGYLVMALYGLAAVDSTVDTSKLLAKPALDKSKVLSTGCYDEILNTYAPLTASQLLVGGKLPDAIIAKLAKNANPAQVKSSVPVMLVQGTADESVPADLTYYLQSQICSYGTRTYLQVINGADHITSVTQSTGTVSQYIQDRFDGKVAPTNCTTT